MAEKDVLSNMFSSFVSRKTRVFAPQLMPYSAATMPPLPPPPPPLLPHMARLSAQHHGAPSNAPPAHSHPALSHPPYSHPTHPPQPQVSPTHPPRGSTSASSQPDAITPVTAPRRDGCRTRSPDDVCERDAKAPRHSRSRSSQASRDSSNSRASRSCTPRRSSAYNKDAAARAGAVAASSSVRGGRGSAGSVEAIATDSTAVATPFHCDKCSKAFRQRSQLSRHFLRVHERKKPFGCAHCDKCFASAFDRKRHVEAVHCRRCIEFFCDRCSFRSKHEKQLEEHIRTMHERDQCRLCGKIFKRAANRVAHERHYHSKTL